MADHPIQSLMQTAMENLKEMVDVNTIVGEPVETPDGSVILPISKVGFGFAAGGSEFVPVADNRNERTERSYNGEEQKKKELPFGGGSGGGVSITPVAFLIVNQNGVRSVSLEGDTHIYDRMLDMAPQVIEKIQSMIKNATKNDQKQQNQKDAENAKDTSVNELLRDEKDDQ